MLLTRGTSSREALVRGEREGTNYICTTIGRGGGGTNIV